MAISTSIIKTRFIHKILDEEGKRMVKNQGFAIRASTTGRTGNLLSNRSIQISDDAVGGKLHFGFPIYLRFLDIRKESNRRRSRSKSKRKSEKGFLLYNRFVYGTYIAIGNRLTTDFTQEVIRAIRIEVEGGGNGR